MRGLPCGAVLQRGPPARSLVGGCLQVSGLFVLKCGFNDIENAQQFLGIHACRAVHKATCKKAAQDASDEKKSFDGPAETAPNSMRAIEAAPVLPTKSPAVAALCGFCLEAKEKLLLCGKCKIIRYCNADHQRQHWLKDVCFL